MPSSTTKSTSVDSSSTTEPVKKHQRCEGTTATGKRCAKYAAEDSLYCALHQRRRSATESSPSSTPSASSRTASKTTTRRQSTRSAPIKRKRRSLAKDDADKEYEIEKLVEKQVFYRVRWVGYPPSQDTWEREEKLPLKSKQLFEKEEEERRRQEKRRVSESDQEDEEDKDRHHRQGSQELESEPEIELEESPATPTTKKRKTF